VLHKSWWFVKGLYANFEGFFVGKHFLTTSNLRVSISSTAGIEFCFWQLGSSSMVRICGVNLVGAVDLCI